MNSKLIQRRNLLRLITMSSLSIPSFLIAEKPYEQASIKKRKPLQNRLSLNAYSFNAPLSQALMTIEDLLEYSALTGFDAVDLTGYYFTGYPEVPSDEYIYRIRQKAFLLGLDISGTGVRNDFTHPDESKRKQDVLLVKRWIEVASKLGAPVIRIFSGTQNPPGFSRSEILQWMVRDIKECVEHGKKYGVMVAIQNHYDFIKTPAETKEIISLVDSSWFGLILDIGSYRSEDPYAEVREMASHAVSWQVKENMFVNNKEVKTDLNKIMNIVRDSKYPGYLPIETLGPGDPKTKVATFLEQVKKAMR